MKTAWTTLGVALAVSLLAVEARAAGVARISRSTAAVGKSNVAIGSTSRQGNLGNTALRSSTQTFAKRNGPSGSTGLGTLSTANQFNAVIVKNPVRKLNLNAVVVKKPVGKLILNQETTTGTKDPRTGQDLSKNANPGFGLPGGKDLGNAFPSGEKQWNDRIQGALGGGGDYLNDGTPFGDQPGSNPMDDFFNQHGGNMPDPLAAYGKGRSGFSPADGQGQDDQTQDGQTQNDQAQNDQTQNDQGPGSVTVGEITLQSMICGSDIIGKENIGKDGDDCIIVEYGNNDNFNVDMANKFLQDWLPKGNNDQQYEGEGGYTGGGGRSANDLYIGSIGRMTGKVVGGRDAGEAGLGKDTGHRKPAICEAIEKYVTLGGKVRGKAGYQGGDSGLGQDIGGAAANKISGLKKAIDAQRFVIDPDAPNPEEVPWWLQEVVSPKG